MTQSRQICPTTLRRAVFIQNGTADCNIPPVQNKNLAEALSAVLGADRAAQ